MKADTSTNAPQQTDIFNIKNTPNRRSKISRKITKHRDNIHLEGLLQQRPEERGDSKHDLKIGLGKSSVRNQQNQVTRSLTQAKKKDKDIRAHDYYANHNIFKLASSTIINHKIPKDDVRLPTLDRKRLLQEQNQLFNPEKRKVVRIAIERLKPLPTDEVKRRFMLKYQLQSSKS